MRGLVSADWQAEFSNLDLCEQAWSKAISICKKEKLKFHFIDGDLKQHYNPVDLRVIKWWQEAIERSIREGIPVYISLGNHDRVGQYSDASNWLPILRRAGATVFEAPGIFKTDGGQMAIIPYMSSKDALKAAVKHVISLSSEWDSKRDLLFFHEDIKGAVYNYATRSNSNVTAKDLHHEKFLACIGGHLHAPQTIKGNIYYVGSPFPCDWGEVNQSKRFLVVQGSSIRSIASGAAPYLDSGLPGYFVPKSWEGVHVRVKVPCRTDGRFQKDLEAVRTRMEKDCPGALVFTVPVFEEDEKQTVPLSAHDSDETKIQVYLSKTLLKEEQEKKDELVSYIAYKLRCVGGGTRSSSGITFRSSSCTNMLSYKTLEVNYRQGGIVVVQGRNLDWRSRSNGSGKTSYVQPIPISLFGTTFKGQKFDSWANTRTKGEAKVILRMTDSRGRTLRVIRTRRPGSLRLLINGVDQSTGMRSNAKDATQGLIEQFTGFNWQTLSNSVYIDQRTAENFLKGTPKERTAILSRFQNLERFDEAKNLVSYDLKRNNAAQQWAREELAAATAGRDSCEEMLESAKRAKQIKDSNLLQRLEEATAKRDEAQKIFHKKRNKIKARQDELSDFYDSYNSRITTIEAQYQALRDKKVTLSHDLQHARQSLRKRVCEACGQELPNLKQLKSSIPKLELRFDKFEGELKIAHDRLTKYKQAQAEFEAESDELSSQLSQYELAYRKAKIEFEFADKEYYETRERRDADVVHIQDIEKKIKQYKQRRKDMRAFLDETIENARFYKLGQEALSRDGIPAFLNSLACPLLNKFAKTYSDLFADGEIQVRFEVVGGEFSIRVLNNHGGDEQTDQSKGELAMAGLITSFALRSIAPPCNILILDEPGDGLDPANARTFAKGLRTLANEAFDTVFVITFNPAILSELTGEKVITVEKRNGISCAK